MSRRLFPRLLSWIPSPHSESVGLRLHHRVDIHVLPQLGHPVPSVKS